MEHIQFVCSGHHEISGCMFCDGGLSACATCGAFEGSWPDDCPGREMTFRESDDVYTGKLNYRDGKWRRDECCKVMRHVHDTKNYMAEAGYVPDGLNNAGNPKWKKK